MSSRPGLTFGRSAADAAWRFVTTALFPGADARESLRSIAVAAGASLWPAVVRLADGHLVTPAVWLGLRRIGVDRAIDPDAARYLEALHAMNTDRNERLSAQLDELLRALNARGIVPVLLKGAAYLKLNTHGSPGARVSSDLDVLVAPDRLDEAKRTLQEIGYGEIAVRKPRVHHLPPLVRDDCAAAVELHWDLMTGAGRLVLPAAEARSVVHRAAPGAAFGVLAPDDALLHSFAHSQVADRYDRHCIIGLRALQDLVALTSFYRGSLDWDALYERTRAKGCERAFVRYLYSAARITGFDAPLSPGFSRREAAYYEVCMAAMRWAWLRGGITLANRLSKSVTRGASRLPGQQGRIETFRS